MNEFSLREATLAGINYDTRVDLSKGIVHDVVLLGRSSKNLNTKYEEKAMQDAFAVVEQTCSYIDHPAGESNDRSIRENFGRFKQPYFNGSGELCAKEFHYNIQNSFAKEFEWMLKNIPHKIGFSINANGRGIPNRDGMRIVESLSKVFSFDLVDGPATTNGIFNIRESLKQERILLRESTMFPQAFDAAFQELANHIKDKNLDAKGAIKALKQLLSLLDDQSDNTVDDKTDTNFDATDSSTADVKALEGASKSKYKFVRYLGNQLEAIRLREKAVEQQKEKDKITTARVTKASEKFKEAKLPDEVLSTNFREQLANAKDDKEVDSLITDRLNVFTLREKETPVISAGQTNDGKVGTPEQLKALTNKYLGA